MNETWIREFARRHGLSVDRRTTAGTDRRGFAAYELCGAGVEGAADEWRAAMAAAGLHADFYGLRRSDHDGRPYLFAESVWSDPAAE